MKKLFYTDPYETEFQATVTECRKDEKTGNYLVVLDQTAFFPEEGGQIADKGTLNGKSVLDVRIRQDVDIIYHILEQKLPVGTTVTGHVDWGQRFDFMQQHSGEHIVSGLVHRQYGYRNVGFHLGLTEVTLDFDHPLTIDQLREIELEANKIIRSNLPIKAYFPSREELAAMDYRSKIELNDDIRIVEIPGVDICACCAPHAKSTAQIGLLKITDVQSHRGGVRVNILCGNRALADYTRKQDDILAVSILLSAKPEAVPDAVKRLMEENRKHKERCNDLQAQILQNIIKHLPANSTEKDLLLFTEPLDTIAIRNAVNELTQTYEGYCAIFSGTDQDGYQFIIGSRTRDCRTLASALKDELGSKGGGTQAMVQGSLPASQSRIQDFINSFIMH